MEITAAMVPMWIALLGGVFFIAYSSGELMHPSTVDGMKLKQSERMDCERRRKTSNAPPTHTVNKAQEARTWRKLGTVIPDRGWGEDNYTGFPSPK
jgi:hypothetical protein